MEEQKRNPAAGLSESEQVQVRRQKLADLQRDARSACRRPSLGRLQRLRLLKGVSRLRVRL